MNMPVKSNIDKWLETGVRAQRNGDLATAGQLYEKVLGACPENADALHLHGLICYGQGDLEKAELEIRQAISSDSAFADFYRSLGKVQGAMGKPDNALQAYQTATSMNPGDVAAHYEMGVLCYHRGRPDDAERCFKTCVRLDPTHSMAYNNLGLVLKSRGKTDAALRCFKQALSIDPLLVQIHCNTGVCLHEQGHLGAALEALRTAVTIDPGYADAHYNMGLVLTQMGRSKEAVAEYEKTIGIQPDFSPAHNNAGIILQELGRTRDAVYCFQKAISLDPRNASAHYNLGILYKYHDRPSAAAACTRQALSIEPDFPLARKELFNHQRDLCEWTLPDDSPGGVTPLTSRGRNHRTTAAQAMMFPELGDEYNQTVFDRAKEHSRLIEARSSSFLNRFAQPPDARRHCEKRITIGYLSNNFRDHPTSHLICDMFACHDRNRFQIDCYSYGEDDKSGYRKRIENECDRFFDLYNTGPYESAIRIYENRVGILVDLNGYTACSRTDICGFRPAPVQVRYLGEAKTTGARFVDYLIGDTTVTPETDAPYYAEKLVRMPNCYQVNSNPDMLPIDRIQGRKQFGLPSGDLVFGSFATSYKIDPELFKTWLNLLKRVPRSVLWLLARDKAVEKNLTAFALSERVAPDRLVFANTCTKPEHLTRLGLADLCLDTRVVNGAATTSDALWAGVPVVTIQGGHFASRMSASILAAVGLPELITHGLEQYEDLAVELATVPGKLGQLRAKLARNRHTSSLFDTPRFVRSLESAFEQMWEIYRTGQSPGPITVSECAPAGGAAIS